MSTIVLSKRLKTGNWLKEWDDFDSLNRISDLFRFCNAEFSYSDLNNTSLIVDEHCAYKAYEIARSRFSMRGTSLFYEIQQLLTEHPNFVEQMKPFVPEWVNKRDFSQSLILVKWKICPRRIYILSMEG